MIFLHVFYRRHNIRKFAYSGRLNENTIRMISLDDFIQAAIEIAYKRAADTTGIQLFDLNPCIF